MDLIAEYRKAQVYDKRKKEIMARANNFKCECFATSIWDITLYKAWTDVVRDLICDMNTLKKNLEVFAENCKASEIILFEKFTFLLACSYSDNTLTDDQRFIINEDLRKFLILLKNLNSPVLTPRALSNQW